MLNTLKAVSTDFPPQRHVSKIVIASKIGMIQVGLIPLWLQFSDLVFCHTSSVLKYISSEHEFWLRDHQALEVPRDQEPVYTNGIFHVFAFSFSYS